MTERDQPRLDNSTQLMRQKNRIVSPGIPSDKKFHDAL